MSLEAGGSQYTHLLLSSKLPGPCPSHKPGLETPSVPFQVKGVLGEQGEPSGCLGFVSHFHHSGRAGWQPERREGLSPAPSTSPGVRVGAGVPRISSVGGENRGQANRKALSPCARTPWPRPAGHGSAIGQLQGFPVASARAGAGLSISSCEAGGGSAAAAGPQEAASREQVAAGGQAGARRWRWPKPICSVAAAPTRAGWAGGKQKGDVCFKKAGNEAARGTERPTGTGLGLFSLNLLFHYIKKKGKKKARKKNKLNTSCDLLSSHREEKQTAHSSKGWGCFWCDCWTR